MRRITRNLLLAGGVALTAGALTSPALADSFRFGINIGPPAYYYAPPPAPYYYYYGPRTYYYYDY